MKKIPRRYDLLIVGGGPAGATLGTLVKKYNPSASVAIVEMEDFPRHHVGESLLPAVPPILKEMGVFDKITSAGFPRKLGGTYVWGRSRTPWTADFEGLTAEQRLWMNWDKLDSAAYSWQVHRAKYDHILLEHARERGVEIVRGRAESVLESGSRITGAKVTLAGGPAVELSSRLLADCSGQRGFLSKFRLVREFDARLQNVAMYAYFRGAPWRTKFIGHPDKTRIFICSVNHGWFWYIPIGKDIVSVGLVTTGGYLRKNEIKDLRAFFAREIKACPEIGSLLKNAEWVGNFDSTGKDFFTVKDWSYLCRQAAGPGWLAAGDAAVFVDPVFSSGVTIAHLSAQRAAYSVTRIRAGASAALEQALWKDYSAYSRDCASAFLIMALYWYGNDKSQRGLWKKAQGMYQSRLPQALSDFNAYIAVISGALASSDRVLGFDLGNHRSENFLNNICEAAPVSKIEALLKKEISDDVVPKLRHPYAAEIAFIPDPKSGSLKDAVRIKFFKHKKTDSLSDVLNPRMIVNAIALALIKTIDGNRSFGIIKAELASRYRIDEKYLAIESTRVLRQLLIWDVLKLEF